MIFIRKRSDFINKLSHALEERRFEDKVFFLYDYLSKNVPDEVKLDIYELLGSILAEKNMSNGVCFENAADLGERVWLNMGNVRDKADASVIKRSLSNYYIALRDYKLREDSVGVDRVLSQINHINKNLSNNNYFIRAIVVFFVFVFFIFSITIFSYNLTGFTIVEGDYNQSFFLGIIIFFLALIGFYFFWHFRHRRLIN